MQRYFLAEIIKASSLSPVAVLNFIREGGIEPSWADLALPYGTYGLVRYGFARHAVSDGTGDSKQTES